MPIKRAKSLVDPERLKVLIQDKLDHPNVSIAEICRRHKCPAYYEVLKKRFRNNLYTPMGHRRDNHRPRKKDVELLTPTSTAGTPSNSAVPQTPCPGSSTVAPTPVPVPVAGLPPSIPKSMQEIARMRAWQDLESARHEEARKAREEERKAEQHKREEERRAEQYRREEERRAEQYQREEERKAELHQIAVENARRQGGPGRCEDRTALDDILGYRYLDS